jgi:hypothetical protein
MTFQGIQQLILKELRQLSSSFKEHAADTGRRLTALETQMDRVIDPDRASRSKS